MRIGEYVRKYRMDHGMSAQELARKAGVSRAYIYQLESGTNPSTKRLPCDCPKLKKDFIERLILKIILDECDKAEVLKEFEVLAKQPDKRKHSLEVQIEKLERKLDKLIDLYSETGNKTVADKYKDGLEKLSQLRNYLDTAIPAQTKARK